MSIEPSHITSLEVSRFKSHFKAATLELAPLTILLGRNNSGKSSLIQALLLLKQTLEYPRNDVPLHLQGNVDALSLRELTSGWPSEEYSQGPSIKVSWKSVVHTLRALGPHAHWPDLSTLATYSGLSWLRSPVPKQMPVETSCRINYGNESGRIVIEKIHLHSESLDSESRHDIDVYVVRSAKGSYQLRWQGELAGRIEVELDHFIPIVSIDKRNIGPRSKQRSFYNGFKILFEQPLEDLKRMLTGVRYLGSSRPVPPSIYRPAVIPPEELGMSGEYAAQMLHARRSDLVRYPIALDVKHPRLSKRPTMRSAKLTEGVNDVLSQLGIKAKLQIEDVEQIGFRLLFGKATLQHVGTGLGYLIPAIVLALVRDPAEGGIGEQVSKLDDYLLTCKRVALIALEEPETHLHPKVQSRLAEWFVSLAMAGRHLIIETHSDHLVRRLRRLVANAPANSWLEKWLRKNVVIAEVEQSESGKSTVKCSRLDERGSIVERWPADFMDEAADEERAIYYAALDKKQDEEEYASKTEVIHDPDGDEEC